MRIKSLLFLCFGFICLFATQTVAVGFFSGNFGEYSIGFDPKEGIVLGYFESSSIGNGTENNPQFICEFNIYGRLNRDEYGKIEKEQDEVEISAWYPGSNKYINGLIKTYKKNGTDYIKVKLDEEPDGAMNAYPGVATEWNDFEFTKKGDWIGVNGVEAKKAYFYDKENSPKSRKAYLVRGDKVYLHNNVYGSEKVLVKYIGSNGKITRGWMKRADLSIPVSD